jgi:benzoyl-CoA reductase/2-hydroxyglutaryl-CoA dehydratase subunit BcrC/BadD/HgdB
MRITGASAIDELRAMFDEPFAALGSDTARDGGTVVISWPSVPVELVRAAGLSPVVARGRSAPTPAADGVLEKDLFPNRLRQLVEAALVGRLTDVAAIVLPRTSDPDYKCFLYLRELVRRGTVARLPPILLFDLLHSDGADSQVYNTDRARALAEPLASIAGRQPALEDFRREIASANRARAAARRLNALRTDAPRVAGVDALPLLGAFWQLEPQRYVALAEAAADALAGRPTLDGPRVLLAGAPVDSPALHAAIEAEGAVIVAELSPFGSGGFGADVDTAGDPFAALAEHYRREAIDARLPVKFLMSKLDHALGGVAAVVISLPADDASFGWDYPRVREQLALRSIPHAVLVGDSALGATAADRERIRTLLHAVAASTEARCG